MRLALTGRHLDISPGLRALVDRKLVRLERLLGGAIVSAQVVCSRQKDRLEADVTVHMRGDHTLASRATGATWDAVLTTVVAPILLNWTFGSIAEAPQESPISIE